MAKNFLLTNEQTYDRKIKEAMLALRIEQAYSKDKILELYLNEIYLGLGSYGVAAAALDYFDKSVHELTLAEAAYLAALPKAPEQLQPVPLPGPRHRAAQLGDRPHGREWLRPRRGRRERPRRQPLGVKLRTTGTVIFAAEYFAEEVRRKLIELYGEKKLYEGGLSVRTTLDPEAAGPGAHRR